MKLQGPSWFGCGMTRYILLALFCGRLASRVWKRCVVDVDVGFGWRRMFLVVMATFRCECNARRGAVVSTPVGWVTNDNGAVSLGTKSVLFPCTLGRQEFRSGTVSHQRSLEAVELVVSVHVKCIRDVTPRGQCTEMSCG